MSLHGAGEEAGNRAADEPVFAADAVHRVDDPVLGAVASARDDAGNDWLNVKSLDQHFLVQDRPMVAARGIIIGILISIPFWALCAVAAYLWL